MTLGAFQTALDVAVAERKIGSNPVRLVKRPKLVKPEHDLWSAEESQRFFEHIVDDRVYAVLLVFGYGLRPEEVCGMRWRDVDLTNKVIYAGRNVRTMCEGKPVEKRAKTKAGERDLPVDDTAADALAAFRTRQKKEKLAAGESYHTEGHVLVDEIGQPWLPDKLRRYCYRLMREAGVRKIKPYEAMRHAAATMLAHDGVSPDIIARWLGHTDAKFTMSVYVTASTDDLSVARDALAARRRVRCAIDVQSEAPDTDQGHRSR